ncbi:hypothetical protein W97_04050 [Coniosporium apollinis CBS 100218]|uniref:CENP-V/GFA domain-containing protein n=1 Tax=Coniosporium apollinis (strain CBS 100218) TaxID=1168221 RepID=R7YT23_CONA1|nr:uncharacterized protein W97_04050 [Coniosporium apollinis CBS 100218]EON64816.1 hypothetical protein W97_04050 [Coniosporium apollinis CBS 100218]
MASTASVTASCLCGTSTYPFTLPTSSLPLPARFCHCTTCRHTSGVLCTTYITVPPDLNPAPDFSTLTPYDSSDRLTRYFCSTCGTHMFVRERASGRLIVCTGVLNKTAGIVQPVGHEWLGDTRDGGASDWLRAIEGRAQDRWLGDEEKSEAAPLNWRSASRHTGTAASAEAKPADRLHAHCHCNGVSFSISRPSVHSLDAGPAPYHSGASAEDPANEPWWLRANRTKFLAGTCACRSCRLASGFDFVAWAFVPTANITLEDGSPFKRYFGSIRTFESSPGTKRAFCGVCGASVFWDGREGLLDVAVGLLDAEGGVRAEGWVEWWTRRVSFGEEAVNGSLIGALEEGLKTWGGARDDA